MIAWAIYSVVVGALLWCAARLGERAARAVGLPARWPWVAGLAALVVIPLLALRSGGVAETPGAIPLAVSGGALVPSASPWWSHVPGWADRLDPAFGLLWLVSTLILLAFLVGGALRIRRRAREWAPVRLPQGSALLSDDFGPALIGTVSGRIVLPRWALGLGAEQLDMIVAHESEHRRSGDVPLLLAGAVMASLFPWNPFVWLHLRSLRAAVELDCDHRVLSRGVAPRRYAELLLELGTRPRGHLVSWAALAATPSLLERRLTMILNRSRRRSAPALLLAAAATVLTVVACETDAPPLSPEAPTAQDEVQQSIKEGLHTAEGAAREFRLQGAAEGVVDGLKIRVPLAVDGEVPGPAYFLDGEPVTNLDGVSPDDIDRIEVIKSVEGGQIHVFRKDPEGIR